MRASCADWNQMLEEHISCAPPLPEADMNHSKKAKEDVSRLKYHVLKAGKRKSSPWHSIPTEILGMILAPDYRLHEPGNVARLGLGINREEKLEAPSTRAAFIAGYTLLNRCSFTPLKWHASWGLHSANRTERREQPASEWFTGWASRAKLFSAKK